MNKIKFFAIAVALLTVTACSNKKSDTTNATDGSTDTPSNISGESTPTQCGEGEFLGADGKSKVALKVAPSLYFASVDQMGDSTLSSAQDVLSKDGQIIYARSIPHAIAVSVNGATAVRKSVVVPPLSLKLFEQDGQIHLAVGSYDGIDYYKVSATALEPAGSNHFLGAVTDLGARDGKLCAIADGGRAVVETSAAPGACSRILYEADNNLAGDGKPLNAVHVASVPEGCMAVTRNYGKVEFKLISLFELLKGFITNAPERIDLRKLEDKLVLLSRDTGAKVVNASVGSYDKVVFSDLDGYPEGAIASYTAFKKANWDDFSATNMVSYPGKKLLQLLKVFFEVRAGGLFIAGGEVKKNVELQGIAWSHTFTPAGGNVTFNELPHFSLPWFPEGAVDGTRYGFKTILAFSIFDFSGIADPNVASLPGENFTWINDPSNPLSQPQNPKGLFTDFGLAEKKLFLNGYSSSKVQSNYDFDAAAKKLMDLAPYPDAFFPIKARFNMKAFPLAVLRDGYFGLKIGPGAKLFYKKAELGAAPATFLPGQFFGAISLTNYKLAGLPVTYESPSGEAGDKFVLAYVNGTTNKLLVEALKTDGSKSAVTTAEADLGTGATAVLGAPFAPVAIFDDVIVVAVDSVTAGPTLETRIYVFKVDGDTLVPMDDGVNPYIESIPGSIAYSIRPLRKADGKYSVLLMTKGGGEKVHRIDFAHNGTDVTESNAQNVGVANLQDLVVGGDKAFGINAFGDVLPLNVAGTNLSADASLGKIVDDPAHELNLSFCGIRQNDIYCSGLFDKVLIQLYKFATDTKTQTTFKYQRPFLLSFTGSKLLVTYDIDGGGIEAFDLSKPAREVNIEAGAPAAPAGEGAGGGSALNDGQFGGGGGCSLNPHRS